MKKTFVFAVTLLAFCFSSLCLADEATHKAAVEKLFDVMEMDKTQKQTIDLIVPNMVQQNPCLKPFENIMRDFLQKTVGFQNIKQDLIALYMREFTEEEVKELTNFYGTPFGKKVLQKVPLLATEGAKIGETKVQENMKELQTKLKEAESKLDPAKIPPECRRPEKAGAGDASDKDE
jgi:hypothetical protein